MLTALQKECQDLLQRIMILVLYAWKTWFKNHRLKYLSVKDIQVTKHAFLCIIEVKITEITSIFVQCKK